MKFPECKSEREVVALSINRMGDGNVHGIYCAYPDSSHELALYILSPSDERGGMLHQPREIRYSFGFEQDHRGEFLIH